MMEGTRFDTWRREGGKQVGKHNKCVREGRKTRDGGNKI